MKRNLLSLLILVLLLVNIALTSVMMINVIGTNTKTAELVSSITAAMNLELYEPGTFVEPNVPLDESESYDLGELTIPLAPTLNEDGEISGKQPYLVLALSLEQNTKHKDYKKLGGNDNMAKARSQILDEINQVVGSHTLEECQNNFDGIRDEILAAVQQTVGSDFIYKISVSKKNFG